MTIKTKTAKTKTAKQPAGPPIAPITRKKMPGEAVGWWIDASEYTPDVPEWGPYDEKWEAEEDRKQLAKKIEQQRKAGITKPAAQFSLQNNDLRLAVGLLAKARPDDFDVFYLSLNERREINKLLFGLGYAAVERLREHLYGEAGIDQKAPNAQQQFAAWAKNFIEP